MSGRVVVLCGYSFSGKSTLAAALREELDITSAKDGCSCRRRGARM